MTKRKSAALTDRPLKRAALYIRVSTEEQALHGLSLQAQQEALLQYARLNELQVINIYADEGITARKRYCNRTAFMRMLKDVESGLIDMILFIKLDRWFRNIADYYEVQRILDQHQVQWIATEERYDTTTANGRLNLNIRLSIAQDESDRTSERIKFVFDNKLLRKEAISGKVPLGYSITQKHLTVDPDAAAIAVDIFKQYLNLRSISALRRYLLNEYGMLYSPSGLRTLLQNERYIGHAHGQDDFCPALIGEDVFYRVQSVLLERAQRNAVSRNHWVYLFTGLVYCSECGNRLSAHTVGSKYIYYRCTRYEKLHLCTHKKRTSELVLEQWLLSNLASRFDHYRVKLQIQHTAVRQVDETRLLHKLEKLKDLYLNDLISREAYERDYNQFTQSLACAKIRKEGPEIPAALEQASDVLSLYLCLSKQNKKAFWSQVLERITVTDLDKFSVQLISP